MASKYNEDMLARIDAFAASNTLNMETLTTLAAEPMFSNAGISARSLIAKTRAMGYTYEAKPKVTKNGDPSIRKDELVSLIEGRLGVEGLDSLAKAEKATLRKLADALTAFA